MKNTTERIDNIARIKIARGDLMQHRRKQNEILAADQGYFYVSSPSQRFIEVHRCAQPGESTT
jgi:hypothetical protein